MIKSARHEWTLSRKTARRIRSQCWVPLHAWWLLSLWVWCVELWLWLLLLWSLLGWLLLLCYGQLH